MLLGELGCASHSSLHSLSINSFSVYTLILNGSFFPFSVTPGTVTFRFAKYFSSILYGCRAPDVRSNVITRAGPASLATIGAGMLSIEGPIATESSRVIVGWVDGDGPAAVDVDADIAAALLDDDKESFAGSAVDIALFDVSAGLVFSSAISDVLVVAGKLEVMGEVEEIGTSLRRPCEPASSLFEVSSSVISTGMDDCGVELDRLVPCSRPVDCVDDAIGRGFGVRCNAGIWLYRDF